MSLYSLLSEVVNKSPKEIDIHFKSIKEFSRWMKANIRYSDFRTLMTAEEVYVSKRGSCHDQVMFEKKIFSRDFKDYKTGTLFFIEHNDKESTNARTHSLLYYKDGGKIYWFENAWGGNEGIHGPYDSVKELRDVLIELHKKDSSYKRYPSLAFGTVKAVKPGINLGDFVSACLNTPLQESTAPKSLYEILNEAKDGKKKKKEESEEDDPEDDDDEPDDEDGTNFSFADDDGKDPAADGDMGDEGSDDDDEGAPAGDDGGAGDEGDNPDDGGSGDEGDNPDDGNADDEGGDEGTDFSFGDDGSDDGGGGGGADPAAGDGDTDPAEGDDGGGADDDTGSDDAPEEPENPEDKLIQPKILNLSTLDRAMIKRRLYDQYGALLSLAYGMQNIITDNKILIDEEDRDSATTTLSSIIEAIDLYLKHRYYINNYEINLRNYMVFSKKLDDLVAFIASLNKHKNNDN